MLLIVYDHYMADVPVSSRIFEVEGGEHVVSTPIPFLILSPALNDDILPPSLELSFSYSFLLFSSNP